jgi:hypothetical protein
MQSDYFQPGSNFNRPKVKSLSRTTSTLVFSGALTSSGLSCDFASSSVTDIPVAMITSPFWLASLIPDSGLERRSLIRNFPAGGFARQAPEHQAMWLQAGRILALQPVTPPPTVTC